MRASIAAIEEKASNGKAAAATMPGADALVDARSGAAVVE
jgi:hypothetical protein